MDGGGTAERQPPLDAPQAEQLAEHLADLRRGDEIARRTERVATDIIAVAGMSERFRHEGGDTDRPLLLDPPAQDRGQRRGRGRSHSATAGRRRAWRTISRPTASTGSDRTWPIVTPPARKPMCASGCRNLSAAIRAIAYPIRNIPPRKNGRATSELQVTN